MVTGKTLSFEEARVWQALADVKDPELPFLSVVDLGIVRWVDMEAGTVGLTPTYTGCPATEVIGLAIANKLAEANIDLRIEQRLSPAWSTDWITAEGRAKLAEHGIAPPPKASRNKHGLFEENVPLRCPNCGSANTELVSAFGATACKAMHRCLSCAEPFEAFKCL